MISFIIMRTFIHLINLILIYLVLEAEVVEMEEETVVVWLQQLVLLWRRIPQHGSLVG
jgi:membrane-anchored glycerophosphoryl diester phosphodiesterase (GDPDase)